MASESPLLLQLDRTEFLLAGTVQSRSDKDRQYQTRIILSSNLLCSCDGSVMRDYKCAHLRLLLDALDKEELIEFILSGHTIPPPFGDE